MHQLFHAVDVFFGRLAAVHWGVLALAICCHLLRLTATSRAWRNIIKGAYPRERVRWRSILGAQLGGVGVNAIVPARGGDAVRLFLAHRCVEGSTYTTLTSTLVLLTAFDFVVASVFALWALTLGVLPGASILRRFSAFDFVWLVRHPREALILFALFFIALLLLLAWFAERIDDFKRRITQGFAILRDKREYVRRVALWQTADWLLRLTAIFWFLRAFGLPATIHNALLVQVSQSLATLLPISPSGIGTEQAFLLYLFRGKVARTTLLSFSVGMRITVMIVNVTVGFIAIFMMLRTFRWRERLEEAPAPERSA